MFGGGYNFDISNSFKLLAEANLNMTFDGQRNTLVSSKAVSIDPSLGIEAGINDAFFIRAAYKFSKKGFQMAIRLT